MRRGEALRAPGAGRERPGAAVARAVPAVALRVRAAPALAALSIVALALGAAWPASAQEPELGRGEVLTLERAIDIALRRNPAVGEAEAAASGAHAERLGTWGAFLPTANVGMGYSRSDFTRRTFEGEEGLAKELEEPITSTAKSGNQYLSLSWTLLQGGQRFPNLAASGARARAAERRVSAAEREAVAEVKRRYYEALKQERLVEVAERQLEGRRRELELARRRYELAAINRLDVLTAELELQDAELVLLDARDAETAAERDLLLQMGVDPETGGELALRDVAEPPDASGLDEEAIARRALVGHPELGALEAGVEAARAARLSSLSRYLPTVSLNLGFSRSQSFGPDGPFFSFDLNDTGRSLSLIASWSLFDGLARESSLAARAAEGRAAEIRLRSRRLEIGKGAHDLAREVRRRAERLRIQERRLEVARQRLEMAREQYRLGSINTFDLQTAIRQLTDAERGVIQERYEALKAWAGLEALAGEELTEEAGPGGGGASGTGLSGAGVGGAR